MNKEKFKMISFLLVLGLFSHAKSQTLTLEPNSGTDPGFLFEYVDEFSWEIINCTLETDLPLENFTITWLNDYDENGIIGDPVSFNATQDFQGVYDTDSDNRTVIFINVTGEVLQYPKPQQDLDNFRKKFYCDGKYNGERFDMLNLIIEVNVPLTLTPYQDPEEYICIDENAVLLTCVFRSYLAPRWVNWRNTYGGLIQDTEPSFTTGLELWTTKLLIPQVNSSIKPICEGNRSTDGINIRTEYANHSFSLSLPLRDDQLHVVTHEVDDNNYCVVRWDGTVGSYVTGFQIKYLLNDTEEVTAEIVKTPNWEYRWKLAEGSPTTYVSLALIMGRCVGPPTNSTGNCAYIEPPKGVPYEKILIGVGTGLGVVVLALLGYIVWMHCRRIPKTKDTSETTALTPLQTNNSENQIAAETRISTIRPYAQSPQLAAMEASQQDEGLYVDVDNSFRHHPPQQPSGLYNQQQRGKHTAENNNPVYDDTAENPTVYLQPMNARNPEVPNRHNEPTHQPPIRNSPRLPPVGRSPQPPPREFGMAPPPLHPKDDAFRHGYVNAQ